MPESPYSIEPYLYRTDSLSTLRLRQCDGAFRARRLADPNAYMQAHWAHHQTCYALSNVRSGHVVLQMSWWRTIEAALDCAATHFASEPRPIQRVPARLPFFQAFERGQDQWLDQAWLYWGEEQAHQTHDNPALSEISLANEHFDVLSPSGVWQEFRDADCLERVPIAGSFDLTLPLSSYAGAAHCLRIHVARMSDGTPWTIVRNRVGAGVPLPLYAPDAFRELGAELTERIPRFRHHRIALTFEDDLGVRVAEIHRPRHRLYDRLRGLAPPAWSARLMGRAAGELLLRVVGLTGLLAGARRHAYQLPLVW